MRLPLYLINDADGVPLPDNGFILDIPIDRAKYFNMVDNDGVDQVILGVTSHQEPDKLYEDIEQFHTYTYNVGILCNVTEQSVTDSFMVVTLWVDRRVYINNITQDGDDVWVELEEVPEDFLPAEEDILEDIHRVMKVVTENSHAFNEQLVSRIEEETYEGTILNILAHNLLKDEKARRKYLQSMDNVERFKTVLQTLTAHVENRNKKGSSDTKKAIRRAGTKRISTPENIKERFKTAPLPDEVREHTQREINKLDSLQDKSAEHSATLDYLTWILDIPWGVHSYNQEYELSDLVQQLDTTHYGLTEVKQTVLEHMTIEKLKGGSSGNVLCFLGPPGTGKTSIAKDIAEASGRKLVRIALGGLSDEAEVRGHRRTYVGSRPGRFIVNLKRSQTMDPLFLLDEIDKVTTHRGDPHAALLEVLDKEQNNYFIDRYLEVPVDLSNAMFICTANYVEQIPDALADRMEFIQFREYSEEECFIIAKNYLLPKAIKELGLEDLVIVFSDDAIKEIVKIRKVRQIEKRMKKFLRRAAVDIVVRNKDIVLIDPEYMRDIPNEFISITRPIGFQ